MEAVIFIAACAALLFSCIFVLRVPLVVACLLFHIASCCFGKYFFSAGLLTVDRLLLVLVVVTYAIRRGMNWHEPKPLGRADYVLGAFIGWLVVRTITSDYNAALVGSSSAVTAPWHLLVGYITPLLMYWIVRQGRLTESVVNKLHVGLALFGIYLAVNGLLEAIGAWSLVFPRYIADPDIGVHFGRVRGPMVQSARFGTYLIICLAATWITLIWQNRLGRAGQLLMLGLLPLYLANVALTYTRSIWMGMGLATLVMLALTLRGRWRPLMISYMIVAALMVAFSKRESLVAFKREKEASITAESTYMRASFAYVSWQMFKERPLFGYGFNQFPIHSKNYLSDRSTDLKLEAIRGYIHHNTFLSILVDTGLVGLLLFATVIVGCIWCAWKLWRDPDAPQWARAHALLHLTAMAPYFLQLLFREVSYSPTENGIICLLSGVTIGLRAKLASRSSQQVVRTATPLWDRRALPTG
jgi:O-antigen ligase